MAQPCRWGCTLRAPCCQSGLRLLLLQRSYRCVGLLLCACVQEKSEGIQLACAVGEHVKPDVLPLFP